MSVDLAPPLPQTVSSNALLKRILLETRLEPAENTFDVLNPADGSIVAQLPDLGAAETELAVEYARQAQPDWASRTAKERGEILRRWHDLILSNEQELGEILTLEQGNRLLRRAVRSPSMRAISTGLPKKPNAPMAMSFRPAPLIAGKSSLNSRLVSSARSHPGTSPVE